MIYLIFINVYIDKCFNYALKRYLAKDIGTRPTGSIRKKKLKNSEVQEQQRVFKFRDVTESRFSF